MKAKKDQWCLHGCEIDACLYCFMDSLRANPDTTIRAGGLLKVIEGLFERFREINDKIDDIEDRIPPRYDPQCE